MRQSSGVAGGGGGGSRLSHLQQQLQQRVASQQQHTYSGHYYVPRLERLYQQQQRDQHRAMTAGGGGDHYGLGYKSSGGRQVNFPSTLSTSMSAQFAPSTSGLSAAPHGTDTFGVGGQYAPYARPQSAAGTAVAAATSNPYAIRSAQMAGGVGMAPSSYPQYDSVLGRMSNMALGRGLTQQQQQQQHGGATLDYSQYQGQLPPESQLHQSRQLQQQQLQQQQHHQQQQNYMQQNYMDGPLHGGASALSSTGFNMTPYSSQNRPSLMGGQSAMDQYSRGGTQMRPTSFGTAGGAMGNPPVPTADYTGRSYSALVGADWQQQQMAGRPGATVDQMFDSGRYRNWAAEGGGGASVGNMPAQQRVSRWSGTFDDYRHGAGAGAQYRSSSLPPRSIIDSEYGMGGAGGGGPLPGQDMGYGGGPPVSTGAPQPSSSSAGGGIYDQSALDRLHVSPVLSRRLAGGNTGTGGNVPLRPAGPGWNADADYTLGANLTAQGMPPDRYGASGAPAAVTGLLIMHIVEGRGLRPPHHDRAAGGSAEEMYCVLEVDGEHRARTGVSTLQLHWRWHETFEVDTIDARQADIYVYSWHPQFRHKLCHRGSLKLLEAFVVDQLSGERTFALALDPRGQLLIRVGFIDMARAFYRGFEPSAAGSYFGTDLRTVVAREAAGLEVPIVLRRLIDEIERRGLDANGIYLLCGSTEKKRELRYYLDKAPRQADLSTESVPDTNVLTSLLKDYLRELPEPVVPPAVYQMLVEASAVAMPNDRDGNARLALGVIDCMPRVNKCTFMVLMDHLKSVNSHAPHNGLSVARLSALFGPLLACTAQPRSSAAAAQDVAAQAAAAGLPFGNSTETSRKVQTTPPHKTAGCRRPVNYLDPRLSASILAYLLDLWPTRVSSSSDSSGSTADGATPRPLSIAAVASGGSERRAPDVRSVAAATRPIVHRWPS